MTPSANIPPFRRLLWLLVATDFCRGIGMFMVLPTTTVPAFLAARGASPLVIGLTATLMVGLMLLLQLLSRAVMDRFQRRKRALIIIHLTAVTPYALIAAADWLLPGHPRAVMILTILLLTGSQTMLGLAIPAWLDMVARVIPLEWRGRYFGLASGGSALGGIIGGTLLLGMNHWLGPAVFAPAFLAAAGFLALSMVAFAVAPVPEAVFVHPAEPLRAALRKAVAACHVRTDFGRLVVSFCAFLFAGAVIPFFTLYATDPVRGLGLPANIFSRMTLWQALGGAVGALALGRMVDRHGPRWPWLMATLIIPLVVLAFAVWPQPAVVVAASLMVGVLTVHWSVSAPALLELSPPGDKSGYIAMANLAGFLPAMAGPLVMGAVIQQRSYHAAFVIAALAGLLAAGFALAIRDRAAPEPV